ncbi:unnamed protein product [Agarophyton chilense]|eukprot:gb/GEZJ01000004.1/.p1 GENE.gb/GEZJ01000004.1/~~gb/GEZJ01000004.1/.p1  ORF type:complete len:292 (-),score=20.65 gb/GEZJ01000004.1/:479-1354(-)
MLLTGDPDLLRNRINSTACEMAFVAAPALLRRRAYPSPSLAHHAIICSSSSATATARPLPPRVVLNPLPKLFVYDHCPFCVRVRHVLGLKNIKHNLVWLANDDVSTPTALVGRKVVPIFQPDGPSGPAYPESLDICAAVDTDSRFGDSALLKPASQRTDITRWMEEFAMPLRRLTRVRFARAPLPEFVFRDAREAYVRNHPLQDPTSYDDNLEKSPEYIAHIQSSIQRLGDMIHSPYCCSPQGLSYDDIVLFPRLRSMTIIKGLLLPPKIRDYLEYHSTVAEIPLYDYCAE